MLGGYWESVAIFLGIDILLALSLYVPLSAGLISLGQGGFMAIGAYLSAVLTKAGIAFFFAILAGGFLAALVGLLVGIPALRIRGIYLMILTLGFGEIVKVFFLNFEPTGAASGLGGIAPLTDWRWVAGACVLALGVVWRMRYSRLGRAMLAVHQDDTAAEAMGINLTQVKLAAFCIGAFLAGIAGALYAHEALFIDPNQFAFARSAIIFLYVVLGGPANPIGPVIGTAVVDLLPEFLRGLQDWRMTVFGSLLVIVAIWRPDGLIGAARGRRR